MDLEVIERLMQMLSNSEVEELEVTEGNLRIRLSKGSAVRAQATQPGSATGTVNEAAGGGGHAPMPPARLDSAEVDASAPDTVAHMIVAGLPGTFYRAPNPGASAFVNPGDDIRDGQQLAIVEAMKMMNPVEADCDGTVLAVLIDDAAAVQAGTPLFRIKRAG